MRIDTTFDTAKSDATKADATKDTPTDSPPPKKHRSLIPGFLSGKSDSDASDRTKSDADAGPVHSSMIMDLEKGEMLTLMTDQKMYMVMSMNVAKPKVGKDKDGKEKAEKEKMGEPAVEDPDTNTDIERTGKSERILGYNCEQILVKDKKRKTVTELWVASGLGTFMGMGGGGPMGGSSGGGGLFGSRKSSSASAAKWEEVLRGKSGFPMRVVTLDAKGVQTYKMEATKVESARQPESLFVPPDDYKKFEMPNFGDMNPFKRE
jgi:hypothetical protein